MVFSLNIPDLEERFLPPPNWQIERFHNPETGRDIVYRTAFIEQAKGTVICLPGLSEYGEKYIETARFLNEQDYNFITLDWAYQGFSTRFQDNPHKRHSDGYDNDLSDLHYLITHEINAATTPLYMLGHSMGGHIGLRYLSEHPNMFQAAAFSAPMLGIRVVKYMPRLAKCAFSPFKMLHEKYVLGGGNWDKNKRNPITKSIFTHDPVREKVHDAWMISTPDLQVGSVTYKWLCESIGSLQILTDKATLEKITCPVLLSMAGKEKLVDNAAIKRASRLIPHTRFIDFKNARHEILMETDDIRDRFLEKTLSLFSET